MTPQPYYTTDDVTLYHGDCREVLPALGQRFDACVADPPYGETSLAWDRWPTGWLTAVADWTGSLWCWGGLRLFVRRTNEFAEAGWKLSQDIVWEKRNGSNFSADRFRRVHETVTHWYLGSWRHTYHVTPIVEYHGPDQRPPGQIRKRTGIGHTGAVENLGQPRTNTRLIRSVLKAPSVHGRSTQTTQKPVEVLLPLIEYAVPASGTVLDPTAGSGSTGVAARLLGRRAVLIEADERHCEIAAQRLDQGVLDFGGVEAI